MGWRRVDICYKLVLFYHSCNVFLAVLTFHQFTSDQETFFLVRVVEMIAIQGQCCNHTKTRSMLSQKISRSKKGSAVRINGNKQKGKKTMEEKRAKRKKKNWKQPRRDLNLHPNFLQGNMRVLILLGHASTTQYDVIFLCHTHCLNLVELDLS